MSIDLGRSFKASVERMLSSAGVLSVAILVAYGFATGVIWSELVAQAFRYALREAGVSFSGLRRAVLQDYGPAAARELDTLIDAPLGIDLGAAVGLVVVLPFVNELIFLVAIRVLAATEGTSAGFPMDAITGGLGIAYLRMVVADIIVWVTVAVGMLLIIPGVVLMILFVFVRQAIVLDGDGVVEALSNSAGLARENLGAAVVIWVVGILLTGGLLSASSVIPVAGLLTVGYAVVSIYTVALTTVAYQQATVAGR